MTQSKLPAESEKTAQNRITLNGDVVDVSFALYNMLLEVLRGDLGHTGTKRQNLSWVALSIGRRSSRPPRSRHDWRSLSTTRTSTELAQKVARSS